ncbi:WS/DGAT domain-containing protein [Fontimonas sp. SYSU GA230001]|uniref:WS/DGAT domain-containing protein n=1 Tax=Fontimonas sp. SYSU GA230001 TaxID=3142450 RepID=UPI0032B480A8
MSRNGAVEHMTAVDRAWLEMDAPHNPMVVSAVLEISAVRDIEGLVRHIVERLLRHRRFRQRVEQHGNTHVWVEDAELLMSYHVRIFHLDERAPDHDVAHAVARELGHPLDRALPLWRLTFFVRHDGRVTMLFRAHHALADGIALVGVLMSCVDGAEMRADGERHDDFIARAMARLDATWSQLKAVGHLVFDGVQRRQYVSERLHEGSEALAAIGRVLMLPDDNPPSLRRALCGTRSVAWTDHLAFAPIRRRAHQLGVKINDLFLAAFAGAIGRYLRETEGALDPAQNLRISIPVNLRAQDDGDLGNCFGLVLLDLPVGIGDWRQRLQVVGRRMSQLKQSPEARAMLVGLAAAGHLPVPWEKNLVNLLAGKAAAVVSNLPGPARKLHVAGNRLESLVFWPPQTGGIGLGVSLFSYAGHVTVGVSADTAVLDDPARLIHVFEDEVALMLHPRKHRASARAPQGQHARA